MDKETLCRAFGSLVQRRDEAGGGADVLVEEQTVGEDRLDVFRRDAPLYAPLPGSGSWECRIASIQSLCREAPRTREDCIKRALRSSSAQRAPASLSGGATTAQTFPGAVASGS